MKMHKGRQVVIGGNVAIRTTTLCGRLDRRSTDGMNLANTDAEVTCTFCLAKMAVQP